MKTEKEKREEMEEELRPFRIHAYSKEELAMLYNPTYCISNAIYTPGGMDTPQQGAEG